MTVKETIAIIGSAGKFCSGLAKILASGNYPLLLLSDTASEFEDLALDIVRETPNAKLEIVDCAKSACWEADIVFLAGAANVEKHFIEKIAQVSAQKPVVYLSDNSACVSVSVQKAKDLEHLLPNSKVLQLLYNENPHKIALVGSDEEAKTLIKRIFGLV